MRTVTLEVSSREETNRRLLRAFEGRPQGVFISFDTPALLFKVLTQKRWELLAARWGAGGGGRAPRPRRRAAPPRRVGRDVKAVHGDVHALLNAGILQKTAQGRIVFPFDAVRVNFMLKAA